MKKILALFLFIVPLFLSAQDQSVKALQAEAGKTIKKEVDDTSTKNWKKGGLYGINISQGSLNNWAAGGDNFSLSVNSMLSLFAFYKNGHHSWDNTFDFNFGYAFLPKNVYDLSIPTGSIIDKSVTYHKSTITFGLSIGIGWASY